MRHLPGFFFGLVFAVAVAAIAVPVSITLDKRLQGTGGTVIDGLGLDSAKYTGWIYVGAARSITLDATFTDANDSATAVTMICWTSRSKSTADGAGAEIHILSDSGTVGTSTSTQHTWSNAVTNGEVWQWTVDNIGKPYVQCMYDATGTPAGVDVITVNVTGKSP